MICIAQIAEGEEKEAAADTEEDDFDREFNEMVLAGMSEAQKRAQSSSQIAASMPNTLMIKKHISKSQPSGAASAAGENKQVVRLVTRNSASSGIARPGTFKVKSLVVEQGAVNVQRNVTAKREEDEEKEDLKRFIMGYEVIV